MVGVIIAIFLGIITLAIFAFVVAAFISWTHDVDESIQTLTHDMWRAEEAIRDLKPKHGGDQSCDHDT